MEHIYKFSHIKISVVLIVNINVSVFWIFCTESLFLLPECFILISDMDGVHLSKFVNLAVTNSSCINNISRVFIQYGPSILHTYLWQVPFLFLRFYRVFSAFPTLQVSIGDPFIQTLFLYFWYLRFGIIFDFFSKKAELLAMFLIFSSVHRIFDYFWWKFQKIRKNLQGKMLMFQEWVWYPFFFREENLSVWKNSSFLSDISFIVSEKQIQV